MIRRLLERPSIVTALYLALTLVMTWPVAAGIARDIPGDLGDPAFVAGIMAWGAEHWLALFTGDGGQRSFPHRPGTRPVSLDHGINIELGHGGDHTRLERPSVDETKRAQ